MSAITVAAALVDTDVNTLATDVAALIVLLQASQTTYQSANPGRYQQGMAGFENNIRALVAAKAQLAQILRIDPNTGTTPALATQYAAF